jgi:hypothetical protein
MRDRGDVEVSLGLAKTPSSTRKLQTAVRLRGTLFIGGMTMDGLQNRQEPRQAINTALYFPHIRVPQVTVVHPGAALPGQGCLHRSGGVGA